MTTALEGGEGSASRPGRSLPPGKTRYPLYRRLGGPQGRSGEVRKISPPPGFDPRTVQPVASPYTNWATRPTYRDWLMLQGTARVRVTALEGLRATTKSARNFHKFLWLMTRKVTGNNNVTNNSEINSAKQNNANKSKGFCSWLNSLSVFRLPHCRVSTITLS